MIGLCAILESVCVILTLAGRELHAQAFARIDAQLRTQNAD